MKCATVAFSIVPRMVMEMPRTEIEFEFDMVFCFGKRLALYAVFSTCIYLQHIARPGESDRPINIVFVRPERFASSRSFGMNKNDNSFFFFCCIVCPWQNVV